MEVLTEIVFPAVDQARVLIASAAALEKRADGPLFADGGLDSMGLVQFIVLVEERIEDEIGVQIRLATDKAMSRRASPFVTLGSLAQFIGECLDEVRDA
jgi:acyl carrier protein